eukprot:7425044-Alexandrium_andersonii.AAC.1
MELAAQMSAANVKLSLSWVPRELNQEADDLSNLKTDAFSEELRVPIDVKAMQWKVLHSAFAKGKQFFSEIRQLREERSRTGAVGTPGARARHARGGASGAAGAAPR